MGSAVVNLAMLMLSTLDIAPPDGLLVWHGGVTMYSTAAEATAFEVHLRTDELTNGRFYFGDARKKYMFRVFVDGKPVCEQEVGKQPVCPGVDLIVDGDNVTIVNRGGDHQ